MNSLATKLKRAIWTYKQPLTRKPELAEAPVSDLFVWKKSDNWKTYFELTALPGLFADNGSVNSNTACIHLFDAAGRPIGKHVIEARQFKRTQVDISALVQSGDTIGTFCVFHQQTPPAVAQLGSHLAERGYVSYRYNDAPLRSYVHGNLDAISLAADGRLQLLAGTSLLPREYRLQHELVETTAYEIIMVNPTDRSQKILCEVLQAADGRKVQTLTTDLPSGGCHIFSIAPGSVARRLVMKSHLVMARPLLFRLRDYKMDVLHG